MLYLKSHHVFKLHSLCNSVGTFLWNYALDNTSTQSEERPDRIRWDHLEFVFPRAITLRMKNAKVSVGTHKKFCHKLGTGLNTKDPCDADQRTAIGRLCQAKDRSWFEERQGFFESQTYQLIMSWFAQADLMECTPVP